MTEDASLDRFASPDAAEDAESDASETPDAAEVSPAVSTCEWSPEGGECADCGDVVERRWRADGEREGELVCPDCKTW